MSTTPRPQTGSLLRRAFGVALLFTAAAAAVMGSPWFLTVGVAAGCGLIVLGERTIFATGVTRYPDRVECRYVPWYEGNSWGLCVLLPIFGVCTAAAGFAPGYPTWARYAGFTILAISPLSFYTNARMRRRCRLTITPGTLVMQRPTALTTVPREEVRSITPVVTPVGPNGTGQVKIVYCPADSIVESTLVIGIQLSVKPQNLLAALQEWKNEPASLDRIESLLRGDDEIR